MTRKMKAIVLALAAGVGGMTVTAAPAMGASTVYKDNQSVNAPYSFDFQFRGAPNAQPVQVFTDEYETYIELPEGVTPHYALVDGHRVQLNETPPYVMIDGAPREFFIRTSHGEAEVIRRGNQVLAANLADRGSSASGECDPVCPGEEYILREGTLLSESLRRYVQDQGWNALRWELDHDYRIAEDIPMHGDMQTAIRGLVQAYQAQGGLMGVAPRFAEGNRVVVIEEADHSGDFGGGR
ncbi:TcpQ domain-containing protein [Thioalkalivibrio sp. ALE19]|uniref:TcpQ domain-containing protein n=1 Tax=Thioalkalivibrio sp. ALE19 TaxID=1266909 RepID=UPI0005B3581C|nr:TcpQ domain-containing protein [Thioalkalivibrio sp. ALE19]